MDGSTPPIEPWLRDHDDVADDLETDLRRGLTAEEAARRLVVYGWNRLEQTATVPRWRKFVAQFLDPLVYLLLFAVAVAFVAWVLEDRAGVPFDVIVILTIVILNAVLGYVQEARAEQAVAALQRMAAVNASVLRDGRVERVPSSDVVPGDVLLLAEGDAVAADARLAEASALTVAEASLTGESEPVLKQASTLDGPAGIGDRLNMVFNGTAVTRGRGRAVVTATGMNTEMGTIALLLQRTTARRTPLQTRGGPHRAHARRGGRDHRGRGDGRDPVDRRHRHRSRPDRRAAARSLPGRRGGARRAAGDPVGGAGTWGAAHGRSERSSRSCRR